MNEAHFTITGLIVLLLIASGVAMATKSGSTSCFAADYAAQFRSL